MTTKIALLIFILCPFIQLKASQQIPDKIMVKGKELALHEFILEPVFKNRPGLRDKLWNNLKTKDGQLLQRGLAPSALWRGYYAKFAIEKKFLVLKDIEVPVAHNNVDSRASVYKNFTEKKNLKITWFTGVLKINNVNLKSNTTQDAEGESPAPKYYSIHVEKGGIVKIEQNKP